MHFFWHDSGFHLYGKPKEQLKTLYHMHPINPISEPEEMLSSTLAYEDEPLLEANIFWRNFFFCYSLFGQIIIGM